MELRHLYYFVAVGEELHFGRAARRLQMTQQPLSQQIRDLERELGTQLFYRTKRTIHLTEVGEVFLQEARKTITQAEQAVAMAKRVSCGLAGRLSVGFTGPVLNSVLPTILNQVQRKLPHVDLSLQRLGTNEQIEALRCGQIHVGLLHPPVVDQKLIQEIIHYENLVAVIPETHPLAKDSSNPLSVKELAQESFILFPRNVGPSLYEKIINLCQQAGFRPKKIYEAAPQQTILGLVATGLGISLIHESVQNIGHKGIKIRPLMEKSPILKSAIAWYPETRNPVLPQFLKVVRENF